MIQPHQTKRSQAATANQAGKNILFYQARAQLNTTMDSVHIGCVVVMLFNFK